MKSLFAFRLLKKIKTTYIICVIKRIGWKEKCLGIVSAFIFVIFFRMFGVRSKNKM